MSDLGELDGLLGDGGRDLGPVLVSSSDRVEQLGAHAAELEVHHRRAALGLLGLALRRLKVVPLLAFPRSLGDLGLATVLGELGKRGRPALHGHVAEDVARIPPLRRLASSLDQLRALLKVLDQVVGLEAVVQASLHRGDGRGRAPGHRGAARRPLAHGLDHPACVAGGGLPGEAPGLARFLL